MRSREETQFRDANAAVPPGTTLKLLATPDERSLAMAQFCERLALWVPRLSITREDASELEFPLMLLPNGVHYQGLPQGTEVPPFIEALTGKTEPLADRLRERLEAAPSPPAALELFVTAHCPFCPRTVRELMPLAAAGRLTRLTVIDAALFPEAAARHGIRAVPTLVLDGQFRWAGTIVLEEVVALMATRDPISMGPAALELLLAEGAAQRLARMMAARNVVFPALLELLCHEKWPVRLGAMVTVEELSAVAPDLGRQALEATWDRFDAASDPVKGDILFLCGEAGDRSLVPRIRAVLQSAASAEVKSAAEDALAKLR
jgi:glutaredoxin